jgi:hypothetical protein
MTPIDRDNYSRGACRGRRRWQVVRQSLVFAGLCLAGCGKSPETLPDYDRSNLPGGPWILAVPNPVRTGPRGGKTMLTWDTTQGFPGQVYVSVDGQKESFVSSSERYYAEMVVRRGHTYDVRLYGSSRSSSLAAVRVRCE